MNNIDIINNINRKDLDEKNYFKSLINKAYNLQLLNNSDMEKIQIELLELLDKIVYKYNGLDSSSIRKELLENIANSNIYTISIYLKSFRNLDDAIKQIKEKGLIYIYEQGRKRLSKMLDVIRVMYIKVNQNKLDINNDTYNDTITKGIKGFLKIYDPDFETNNIKITADYPLYNNLIGKLDGVEFIKDYLNSIYLENQFCKMFSEEKIKYLLFSYSPVFKDLIINIFEIVLLEVFACKLANINIKNLIVSEANLDSIYGTFNKKTDAQIYEIIQNTYNEIKLELISQNSELQKYIESNLNYIKEIIKVSLHQKTLDKIFITQKFITKK